MIDILWAGRDLKSLPAFHNALDTEATQLTCRQTGAQVLACLDVMPVDVLIADEDVIDMSGLELIAAVIARQPMLDCAVLSALSPDAFHEASEGLGVLMQLPISPGAKEARRLLAHVRTIKVMMDKTNGGKT